MQTDWFETSDGARLRYQHWALVGGAPALLLPGRGEPTDKYEEVAAELLDRGFAVWALNWRGQGGSTGVGTRPRRGFIRTFERYLRDLDAFTMHLSLDHPIVFAHSMGAHVALRLAHDSPVRFGALVLSAPMLGITLPAPLPLVRIGAELLVALGQGERFLPGSSEAADRIFEGNELTQDRDRFERYLALLDAQPDLITGGATIAWLRAALDSLAVIRAPGFAERIETPCLLFAPALDALVPPAAIRTFAGRLPHGTFVQVPKACHELFQERDVVRAALWRQIDAFLAARCQAKRGLPEISGA